MAIAHVQSGKNGIDNTAQTSVSRAYGSAVGVGALLVCVVVWWSNTSNLPSVSDSVNGAWSVIGTPVTTGPSQVSAIFYRANSAAGTPTVTATWGASTDYPYISTYEFSGAATTSPLDTSANAGPTTNTAPTVGLTLAEAGELVFFTATPTDIIGFSMSPGTGMTSGQQSMGLSTDFGSGDFYATSAGPGSFSASAVLSGTTGWKARAAAFKQAAAPTFVRPNIHVSRAAVNRASSW